MISNSRMLGSGFLSQDRLVYTHEVHSAFCCMALPRPIMRILAASALTKKQKALIIVKLDNDRALLNPREALNPNSSKVFAAWLAGKGPFQHGALALAAEPRGNWTYLGFFYHVLQELSYAPLCHIRY